MLSMKRSILGLLLFDTSCIHGVARCNCCHRYGFEEGEVNIGFLLVYTRCMNGVVKCTCFHRYESFCPYIIMGS